MPIEKPRETVYNMNEDCDKYTTNASSEEMANRLEDMFDVLDNEGIPLSWSQEYTLRSMMGFPQRISKHRPRMNVQEE